MPEVSVYLTRELFHIVLFSLILKFWYIVFLFPSKCSNEAVFAADFHPTDTNIIVTCGKSHLYFWTLEGNSLIKKQGLFEVKYFLNFMFVVMVQSYKSKG